MVAFDRLKSGPLARQLRADRLPPTGPGSHRSEGTQADHALIFKLDHLGGADHCVAKTQAVDWQVRRKMMAPANTNLSIDKQSKLLSN
jgi:hypothetical protein